VHTGPSWGSAHALSIRSRAQTMSRFVSATSTTPSILVDPSSVAFPLLPSGVVPDRA